MIEKSKSSRIAMFELYGQCSGPVLLLHGGASTNQPSSPEHKVATNELRRIAALGMKTLSEGGDAKRVVVDCLKAMEAAEHFNAGHGAALQADGAARLTAAFMDGTRQSFSGVISVQYVTHPSELALELQTAAARVLTNPGAELLARKLGLPLAYNITEQQLEHWSSKVKNKEISFDTVGCVVRTNSGELIAATSTGGVNDRFPGRVSDSATVAGTYCSEYLAASATGTGEEIVDDAVCARMETRVRDGMTLHQAANRNYQEALQRKRNYGWIALSKDGSWSASTTTASMSFVVFDASGEVTHPSMR